MFFLDRAGFLGLLGLFAQTAMTWLFVGLFAVLLRDRERPRYLRTWCLAFVALGVGLTLLCVRFFRAHDDFGTYDRLIWTEGAPLVSAIYSGYLVCKILFAHLLLRGTAELAQRPLPRAERALAATVMTAYAVLPWIQESITPLLGLQVPVMVGYCYAAHRLLPRPTASGMTGRRLLRVALVANACCWLLHGLAAVMSSITPHIAIRMWLSLGSHVDAGLELLLGASLIVTMLQDMHGRLRDALQEQARMRTEAERDEKLRALGVLVSGVAHELNNPLTAILGFAHELDETSPGGYAAQVIREQAERCRGIVRSLSALAGECAHPREAVDLKALVERVVRGFQPQLQHRRIEIDAIHVPPVVADSIALEQVVANLIANAIQASPEDGEVRVAVHADAANVVVDVDDQGPGVPQEVRHRLFEPFFTTKPPGQGTGLGLAVAFAIVRAHHGQLIADQVPNGRGARFRLRLPIASSTEMPKPTPSVAAPRVARRRLLVVDDEPSIRAVLRRRGEQLGWTVDVVDSAEAALRFLEGQQVDVVLCDVRMPGLGGQGFHAALRQQAPRMLPRCLFFTGEIASPEVMAFAASLSAPLITKPFDFAELFRRAAQMAAGAA